MTALPYMPFFVADYLADTQHLTTREHGAYLLLIMNYWQRQGPLPGDDKRLAAITRMTFSEWQAVKPTIEEFFDLQCDGKADAMRWHHARIDHELRMSEAKKNKARASANARWNKDNNAVALQTDSERNAPTQPNVKKKIPSVSKKKVTARATRLPDDWMPSDGTFLWCQQELQWSRSKTHETLSYFRDYWHSEGGQRARKVDWDLTFKNWCRREGGQSSRPNSKSGWGEAAMEIIENEGRNRQTGKPVDVVIAKPSTERDGY